MLLDDLEKEFFEGLEFDLNFSPLSKKSTGMMSPKDQLHVTRFISPKSWEIFFLHADLNM